MVQSEKEVSRYRIDAGQSRFVVQAFAEGLFSAFGHNPTVAIRDLTGEIQVKPGALESAGLQLTVRADSLVVTDEVSDKDRKEIERVMREEVLETAKFPEIVFKSTTVSADQIFDGMYRVRIAGELSLHGVTRQHQVEGQVTLSGDALRARGESRLRQSDYKIKRVSVAGGTLKVKEEVKLWFEIVAKKL
jgi:polyisoprenoid-binding protein YceI